MPNLFTLILQIGVILLTARLAGVAFRKIHQPQVVGEMVAGILLGPSLLGWLAPGVSSLLFPPASLGYLSVLSQVGLVLFMFLVGLSLNPKELREYGHAAVLVSHVSIIVPFTLAAGLALFLYPLLSDSSVRFSSFALFMGSAMSVTAFPVLARILTERGLLHTRMGTLAIACAAVDDVTGWCILAYLVVLVRAGHSATPLWITLTGSAVFAVAMVTVFSRLVKRFETAYAEHHGLTENALCMIILFALACALTTEALGIHFLFGAFLAGAIMPKNRAFVHDLREKFQPITVVLLVPLYFAFTGLRTRINLVKGPAMWACCVIIIATAVIGKFGGSMGAARMASMPWRDACALGAFMNTRGLMELIVLNIGLDIGVLSPALFSMMVLMALVTTLMATPLLSLIYPHSEAIPETVSVAARAAS